MIKKILVVEDNEKHLKDAQDFFGGLSELVNVSYASSLIQASQNIHQVDGVISDVFYPVEGNPPYQNKEYQQQVVRDLSKELTALHKDSIYAQFEKIQEWVEGKTPPPSGIILCQKTLYKRKPVVLITSIDHHTAGVAPIHYWAQRTDMPLIDHVSQDGSKGWESAYLALATMAVMQDKRVIVIDRKGIVGIENKHAPTIISLIGTNFSYLKDKAKSDKMSSLDVLKEKYSDFASILTETINQYHPTLLDKQ